MRGTSFSLRALALTGALLLILIHEGLAGQKDTEYFPAGQAVLWMDPGDVPSLDFRYGAGKASGQPTPPFQFVREDVSGTTDKIEVLDNRGLKWNIKWGQEARPSTFCNRLAWACGYFTTPEYFIHEGRVEGVHDLSRAKSRVSRDGSFVNARFQLRTDSPKFLKDYNWKWTSNPFVGKRELHGLKILTMLVSNVDAKNSNLGVFEETFNGEPRYLFATVDWGSSLGTWGGIFTQSIGNCKGFAKQNSNFIEYDKKGRLRWAFNGKRGDDLIEDISPSDVRWLLQYLGRITDHQIEDGLSASGMNSQETTCYTRALRDRIEQMRRVAAAAYQ